MRKSRMVAVAAIAAMVVWSGVLTGDEKNKGQTPEKGHIMVRGDDIKWGPAPPGLPTDIEATVLMGDPSKAEPYVVRARMPDGCRIPPHWHPEAENVTVLKGTLMVGRGEKFSVHDSEPLPAGSFMSMPKGMRHFAWAKGDTIVQVHGMGPFDITYVNPKDDPRKK